MIDTRRKWAFGLLTSGVLAGFAFVVLLLNPGGWYARRTVVPHYTIYHNRHLDPALLARLAQARAVVRRSACFDSTLRLNVCLNDGSRYPGLVEALWGPAFGWGFYRNVVLGGEATPQTNGLRLNGYTWNLAQLLAHESVHCYQLRWLGFWRSDPVAGYPAWKWEGYAEYVTRQGTGQPALQEQVRRLAAAQQADPAAWAVVLADGTCQSRDYARYHVLTRYCLDVKKLTYEELLADTASARGVEQQLQRWCQLEKGKCAWSRPEAD